MKSHLNEATEKQIQECIDLLKEILKEDLLGVYLYGSAMVGGLQKYSDIDIFVISNRLTTTEEKIKLATAMLSISGVYLKSTKRPIELTMVVKTEINPWHYPPHCDFQYGDWLREEFEKNNFTQLDTREMPDLALLITQVLLASTTLFGQNPTQLIDPVPYRDFIKASTKELDTLLIDLAEDTRNVLLTLARIWCTVESSAIHSKPSAAVWVIERLPEKYIPVMKRALEICLGNENEHWDDIQTIIKPCAEFIQEKIKELTANISDSEYSSRSIKLAEY